MRSPLTCHPARSRTSTACVPAGTTRANSARNRVIAPVETSGSASATPAPRSGQTAPNSWTVPRPTVLRDTALQVEDCKEVEDGRGRWDGRAPVGARPSRWRRRVHARAPRADVGAPQAGRGAEAVAGRGSGSAVAPARGDRRGAERLEGRLPGSGRGVAE